MLIARSLWEAEVYVALKLAEAEPPAGAEPRPAPPLEPGRSITEGPDAWVYASPVGELTVPYESERSSSLTGAHFGLGRSRLIDAAEWVKIAHLYGERAVEDQMHFAAEPPPEGDDPEYRKRRHYVELGWELAAEAIVQAMQFLPEGADKVPDTEIWSEFGATSVANDPHLVTRARLEEDLEYYRGVLQDFRDLHSAEG
ncbi:hypothetical protein [Kribbella sp. HUAS MG21]|uniref:Uncharacterized protein n=1 Tax=Kribbella sp. HUAS MG21 TaxID=3160966 RepID=A0AAU7TAI0_9ACTN